MKTDWVCLWVATRASIIRILASQSGVAALNTENYLPT